MERIENNGNSVSGTPDAPDGLTPGQVYAQNVASVVLVYARSPQGASSGSGFVLTDDGYVVTNCHVIEGGSVFTVVTSDNRQHEARLVGKDSSNDVAVLKIDNVKLQAVTLGSSDVLIVGDQVAAIGNPLGELTSTLTVGYVSATGRYVTTENTTINMIQTDCAINSGNSGGPLFNMKGEVVAITTAKYSGLSSSGASIEGIGFAIPMDDIIAIIEDLIEFGYANTGYLGVMVNNQNEIEAGLPEGTYITDVVSGYCAEKAGIKAGDYIVELGGHKIRTMNDLTRILRRMDPGTTTTVKVLRGRRTLTLEITLDQRPADGVPSTPQEQVPMPEEGSYEEWYEYFKWFFENEGKP
jgi:serine protease Do